MAGVQDSELAIAVCKAGGLGSLPCAMLTPDRVASEIAVIRAGTDQPFNVNFFCHQPPVEDVAVQQAWQASFSDYYSEWGIDPASVKPGPSRVPFNEAMLDVLLQHRPPVVSFHFGLPAPEFVAAIRETGAKVLSSATTVEEALWLERNGVDAVIAQGLEAGGHRGVFLNHDLSMQSGLMALLPQIVSAVKVPVIAAGGIADADGARAAMMLGAAGVQIGTAFLLCHEAKTSTVHRAALRSPHATHTALTNVFTGRPARGIVNRLMRDKGLLNADAPAFPLATSASAPLRAKAEAAGNGDFTPLWAGQNTSGCCEISATELTQRLMRA